MKTLCFILLTALACWRQTGIHEQIRSETDSIYDKLIRIRRDFHANPELAGNEIHTQAFIKQYLLNLGLEVQTDIYGYSLVGILKGSKPGKQIAWRAEMDALPNNFPDEVPFKSIIKGVQHSCGHDVHMAVALGIAEVLAKHRASLAGTVYFIFQSEEETFQGARGMIDHQLFSVIHPDEIYALHVTVLPVGVMMVKPNEMFAYQKRVRIKLKEGDAEELSAKIYSSLSRVPANSKPWEIQHIGDRDLGLINPNTIFKDYLIMDQPFNSYTQNDSLFLETYLYETNAANLQKIIPGIKQLVGGDVSFIQENPTVVNDEELTKNAVNTLRKIYGNNIIVPDYGQVPYFNDDFAYFQQKVPGVYFFLGGSNVVNHAPGFKVDEESIRVGVRSFSSLMIERLRE
ncbi:M20/M25/M40 family metallo-hydrolase [Chitinophaga sp.]|uniref:M20 metallopeptidase family protein n=1 Tax=Chitinophaga sp. TaxID=1869181 RepID=UPI0031D135FC